MKQNIPLLARRGANFKSLQSTINFLSVKPILIQSNQSLSEVQYLQALSNIQQYKKQQSKCQSTNIINQQKTNEKRYEQQQNVSQNKNLFMHSPFRSNLILRDHFQQSFELGDKIGQGAHGVVKKCIHKETQKQFAVKIIHMQDQHFQQLKTNFLNIKKLKSDYIIKYKALYLNSKSRLCHLVMQYLPFSKIQFPMQQKKLRHVFYKLLSGLTFLHKNNICHRDIKPDNILWDQCTKNIKIIDFGVSKNMKLRARYQLMMSHTGTLIYKAPEMFKGSSYCEKIDSWAVGVSMYEMVTGKTPFEAEYLKDTIENICSIQPSFDHLNFSKYSSLLKDLLLRLLKKSPNDRLSCQQAKRHLWFSPHLSDIKVIKSASLSLRNQNQTEISCEIQDFTQQPAITQSFKMNNQIQFPQKITKGQKDLTKGWLQILNDRGASNQDKFQFPLMNQESDSEQQNQIPQEIKQKLKKGKEKIEFFQNN